MKNFQNLTTITAIFIAIWFGLSACSEEQSRVKEENKPPEVNLNDPFANTIGAVENGTFVATTRKALKKQWEEHLQNKENPAASLHLNQTTPVKLTGFKLAEQYDGSFLLIASSADGTVKIGSQVEKRPEGLALKGVIVTCSGCTEGCEPQKTEEGHYRCTDCYSSGTCTKTVTAEYDDIRDK